MGKSERQTVEFNFYLTLIWERYLFGERSQTGATLLPSAPHRRRGFASQDTSGKMCSEGLHSKPACEPAIGGERSKTGAMLQPSARPHCQIKS
jgi:hypothetical protein